MNFIWYWILQKNLNNASLQNWSKYSIFLRTAVIIIFRDTAEGSSLFRCLHVTSLYCTCFRFLHAISLYLFLVSPHGFSASVSGFSTLPEFVFRFLYMTILHLYPLFPRGFSVSISGISTWIFCICFRFFQVAFLHLFPVSPRCFSVSVTGFSS